MLILYIILCRIFFQNCTILQCIFFVCLYTCSCVNSSKYLYTLYFPGNAIRTSFDKERTAQFAFHMHTITSKARNCLNDMDSSNELQFIRIRSKCHEIMIAPGNFTIYFIHNENIVCLYIYVVLIAPF